MSFGSVEERVRRWCFDEALPLWASQGVDPDNGGFVECLDFEGRDVGVPFKRVRVTCRQTYVFAHAHLLGVEGVEPLIRHGLSFLTEAAFLPEAGVLARRMTREGGVLDPTPDLYDTAFALFAFSWAHRALKDDAIEAWIYRTADAIENALRHPSGIGFWNDGTHEGPRKQNPHMHLLEASLAAFDATQNPRFAALAKELVGLFQDRLFDRSKGMLPELYDDQMAALSAPEGTYCEPGHQFEWAWILVEAKKRFGLDIDADVRSLIATAEKYGVSGETGAGLNRVAFSGEVLDGNARSWPTTERIKAAIALFELDGTDPTPIVEECCETLFTYYLNHGVAGVWGDEITPDGEMIAANVPASILYHLFLAFAEIMRIAPRVQQAVPA